MFVEDAPSESGGKYTQVWIEVDRYSTPAEEEAATLEHAEKLKNSVRAKRDIKLADTDWTGMSDVTMSAEMATYRQALRDITALENFPSLETDDWPAPP